MKIHHYLFTALIALSLCGLSSKTASAQKNNPQMVCIRGNSPEQMLQKGLSALGGIKRFVHPGQRVLIVPTLLWNKTPAQGANANPQLVAALTRACYRARASSVHVLGHTIDPWTKCYKNSGIERASKDAGARVLPANKAFLYETVENPEGHTLKKISIHQDVLDADVIINVAAVNQSPHFGMTGAFYNLLELIWNQQPIINDTTGLALTDLARYCAPSLTIWDGLRIVTRNGPSGKTPDDVRAANFMVLSGQLVAGEFEACKLARLNPDSLVYLQTAAKILGQPLQLSRNQISTIGF